jgi:hypothetical protein
MRRRIAARLASLALASAALALPAGAQLCAGAPSFEGRPVQIGAGADFADGVSTFGGALGLGRHNGAFGSVGVGVNVYDETINQLTINESSVAFTAGAGYQIPLGTTGRAQLCPMISGTYENGPKNVANEGIDFTSGGGGLGLRLGGDVPLSPTLSFVPWGGGSVVYWRSRVRAETARARVQETSSDTYGVLGFGGTLLVNHRFSFGPSISIPVGLEGAKPSYGVSMAIALGGR